MRMCLKKINATTRHAWMNQTQVLHAENKQWLQSPAAMHILTLSCVCCGDFTDMHDYENFCNSSGLRKKTYSKCFLFNSIYLFYMFVGEEWKAKQGEKYIFSPFHLFCLSPLTNKHTYMYLIYIKYIQFPNASRSLINAKINK